MKKFFLFAAAILAAVAVSAQTTYDFTNIKAESDYSVSNLTKNSTATTTKIVYDQAAGLTMDFYLIATPQVHFQYTTADKAKTKAFTVVLSETGAGYVEFGGGKGEIHISNVTIGQQVVITAASKSADNASELTVVSGATGDNVSLPVKDNAGYKWVDGTFTATADAVVIQDTKGARITKVVVKDAGSSTGLEQVENAANIQKVYENGQIYILKDGVKYNLLGAIAE
mgnify:CR=1 FL=1